MGWRRVVMLVETNFSGERIVSIFRVEDGDCTLLRNVDSHTASQPRRPQLMTSFRSLFQEQSRPPFTLHTVRHGVGQRHVEITVVFNFPVAEEFCLELNLQHKFPSKDWIRLTLGVLMIIWDNGIVNCCGRCEIWGPHGGEYEDGCLPGCSAV
jgi:hypothetical protein